VTFHSAASFSSASLCLARGSRPGACRALRGASRDPLWRGSPFAGVAPALLHERVRADLLTGWLSAPTGLPGGLARDPVLMLFVRRLASRRSSLAQESRIAGGAPARQWRGIRDRDTVEPCAGSPLPYVHRDGVPCLQLALICEGVQGLEVCGLVVVVAVLSKPRAACTSPEAALRSSAARVLASAVRVSLFCSRAVAAVLLARSRQAFSSGVAPRSLAPRGGRQPRAVRR
jgi:hypothetical protein